MTTGNMATISRWKRQASSDRQPVVGMRISMNAYNIYREGVISGVSADKWMSVEWDNGRVSREPFAMLSHWSICE